MIPLKIPLKLIKAHLKDKATTTEPQKSNIKHETLLHIKQEYIFKKQPIDALKPNSSLIYENVFK